jgi:hypothetical protein
MAQKVDMTGKKHNLTISEPQRRLIVHALGTAITNGEQPSRASGSCDDREELFELICIFSTMADDDLTSS